MKNLLLLAHRIPFPPNKGDKIRSFNLLKHLSRSHRIYLGTFIDDPHDWRYLNEVQAFCGDCCFLPLNPLSAKIKSLRGLLTGEALSVPYYFNRKMKNWVDQVIKTRAIDKIFVYSSAMAQYVDRCLPVPKFIDFVDVDSDKWKQYAQKKSWPLNWIYNREGRLLLKYDRQVAGYFDQSFFVSALESELFKTLAPECADSIACIDNGVDCAYFLPHGNYATPYREGEDVLVFTGAMDYWANVDAVRWFADEVFPQLWQHHRCARLYIVGARPVEGVRNLARRTGIVVTGAVRDIRPYLAHARLAVAPLRIARGVQNKVLEAMAMAKSVLATTPAVEGIPISQEVDVAVADKPSDMAQKGLAALRDEKALPSYSRKNREFVQMHYSWDKNLCRLNNLLEIS